MNSNSPISNKNIDLLSLPLSEFFKIPRFIKDFYAVPEYRTPKTDFSPNLTVRKRCQSPNAGAFALKKVIVKPQESHNFLEKMIKERRNSPSPGDYQKLFVWASEKKDEKNKEKKKDERDRFLPPINHGNPGVGDYNLIESAEQINKRMNFFKKMEEIKKK